MHVCYLASTRNGIIGPYKNKSHTLSTPSKVPSTQSQLPCQSCLVAGVQVYPSANWKEGEWRHTDTPLCNSGAAYLRWYWRIGRGSIDDIATERLFQEGDKYLHAC
jgi:hypothetical protein